MALDLTNAIVKRGKISERDRSFDYEFWREQSIEAKLTAIWEMTVFHHMVHNRNANEPRLNRTVGGVGRISDKR